VVLPHNALKALSLLKLEKEVEAASAPIAAVDYRASNGAVIKTVELSVLTAASRSGPPPLAARLTCLARLGLRDTAL
jgi:hypothetical protein